ncbi:MAG: hypothetical protein ACM4D3_08980 [Candidatus Sericytochromatia bacterium]
MTALRIAPNIPYIYPTRSAPDGDTGVDDDWLRNVLHHNAARLFELQTA